MMNKLKRVLLVDDDEIATFLNANLLEKLDCAESIITASNGQEAYEMLLKDCSTEHVKECWLDLVLLDINMPIMNGFDFLKACREKEFRCAPKVVLLSSSRHQRDLALADEFDLTGILTKPLTEDSLTEILVKHFNCCNIPNRS